MSEAQSMPHASEKAGGGGGAAADKHLDTHAHSQQLNHNADVLSDTVDEKHDEFEGEELVNEADEEDDDEDCDDGEWQSEDGRILSPAEYDGQLNELVAELVNPAQPIVSPTSPLLRTDADSKRDELVQSLKLNCKQRIVNGNLAGALLSINRAIKLRPADANTFELRCRLYSKMKKWQNALSDAQAAIRLLSAQLCHGVDVTADSAPTNQHAKALTSLSSSVLSSSSAPLAATLPNSTLTQSSQSAASPSFGANSQSLNSSQPPSSLALIHSQLANCSLLAGEACEALGRDVAAIRHYSTCQHFASIDADAAGLLSPKLKEVLSKNMLAAIERLEKTQHKQGAEYANTKRSEEKDAQLTAMPTTSEKDNAQRQRRSARVKSRVAPRTIETQPVSATLCADIDAATSGHLAGQSNGSAVGLEAVQLNPNTTSASAASVFSCAGYSDCEREDHRIVVQSNTKYVSVQCDAGCRFFYHLSCYKKLQANHDILHNASSSGMHSCYTPHCDGHLKQLVFHEGDAIRKERSYAAGSISAAVSGCAQPNNHVQHHTHNQPHVQHHASVASVTAVCSTDKAAESLRKVKEREKEKDFAARIAPCKQREEKKDRVFKKDKLSVSNEKHGSVKEIDEREDASNPQPQLPVAVSSYQQRAWSPAETKLAEFPSPTAATAVNSVAATNVWGRSSASSIAKAVVSGGRIVSGLSQTSSVASSSKPRVDMISAIEAAQMKKKEKELEKKKAAEKKKEADGSKQQKKKKGKVNVTADLFSAFHDKEEEQGEEGEDEDWDSYEHEYGYDQQQQQQHPEFYSYHPQHSASHYYPNAHLNNAFYPPYTHQQQQLFNPYQTGTGMHPGYSGTALRAHSSPEYPHTHMHMNMHMHAAESAPDTDSGSELDGGNDGMNASVAAQSGDGELVGDDPFEEDTVGASSHWPPPAFLQVVGAARISSTETTTLLATGFDDSAAVHPSAHTTAVRASDLLSAFEQFGSVSIRLYFSMQVGICAVIGYASVPEAKTARFLKQNKHVQINRNGAAVATSAGKLLLEYLSDQPFEALTQQERSLLRTIGRGAEPTVIDNELSHARSPAKPPKFSNSPQSALPLSQSPAGVPAVVLRTQSPLASAAIVSSPVSNAVTASPISIPTAAATHLPSKLVNSAPSGLRTSLTADSIHSATQVHVQAQLQTKESALSGVPIPMPAVPVRSASGTARSSFSSFGLFTTLDSHSIWSQSPNINVNLTLQQTRNTHQEASRKADDYQRTTHITRPREERLSFNGESLSPYSAPASSAASSSSTASAAHDLELGSTSTTSVGERNGNSVVLQDVLSTSSSVSSSAADVPSAVGVSVSALAYDSSSSVLSEEDVADALLLDSMEKDAELGEFELPNQQDNQLQMDFSSALDQDHNTSLLAGDAKTVAESELEAMEELLPTESSPLHLQLLRLISDSAQQDAVAAAVDEANTTQTPPSPSSTHSLPPDTTSPSVATSLSSATRAASTVCSPSISPASAPLDYLSAASMRSPADAHVSDAGRDEHWAASSHQSPFGAVPLLGADSWKFSSSPLAELPGAAAQFSLFASVQPVIAQLRSESHKVALTQPPSAAVPD